MESFHLRENPLAISEYGALYIPEYWKDCKTVDLLVN